MTLIEEEMAALQLVQEIEDEKAKASRLEWCLREILAERDVLLRQHEDEARRKRQEELHSLNHHLNLNLHASASSPCVVAPGPAPALNPHARPRSTSAPPAMITAPPALLPVGPPSAAAQPPPLLRPQPHSFRIVRQHQLQLQQQQKQQLQQRQHQHQQASCEAARLLGLSPSEAEAPTDTMVVVGHSAKYQGPVKRARLGTSLPVASSSNQPNQLQLQPLRPATVVQHQSASVTARQSAPVTSVDANRFHPLQPHQVQHQHQHHGHDHHQHVCGGPNSAAGCESPVGCLPFGGTPPQCAAGFVAAAAAAGGGSLSASSSSSSFEWNNSCSSTTATPMPTPTATLAGGDCATEWPLAGLNDEFDYDALLDNLSSGL